jgi:hypothetical protein
MDFKALSSAALASLLLAAPALAGQIINTPEEKAMAAADEIITMRSSLAAEFIKPGAVIDEETFKKVCGAVAKRVKDITEKTGVKIRHAAVKNRNPLNAANESEAALIKRFETDKSLSEIWEDGVSEGKAFKRYTRPIFVEEACLACHGPKEARPEFIKTKYPDDKAYDFEKGALRGIISVTVPAE